MAKTMIYGIHAIQTALEVDPENIKALWADTSQTNKRLAPLLALARQQGITVQSAKPKQLEKLAGNSRHQHIVADYHCESKLAEEDLFNLVAALKDKQTTPLLLMLDGVTDPHNLGACLRTAEGAGVQAVIVPKDNAVGLTPIVRKVASGAAERIPLITVTNLARTLDRLKELGLWVIGTSDKTDTQLYQQDLTLPLVLVMGAEGKGIRPLTAKQCDILLSLPMMGEVSSLNVSVATGVCLYEALRQRLKQAASTK